MQIRSLLYNLMMWLSVLIYAPLALLTAPFPFNWRYRFIVQWGRYHIWLARRMFGIDYHVEGRENLPSGAAVVLSKHQSTWETLAFPGIFPPFVYILKRELLWIPLFGWALALLKPIAVNRRAGRQALDQVIQQGRQRLEAGISVVVFPEGTRVAPGQRRPYKGGGAALACATGYPVVPVAHNAGSYWPRRSLKRKSGTIWVAIGPAIDTHGKSATQTLRAVEEWIEHTMARLETRPH